MEAGRESEWTARNWRTWERYWEHAATGGPIDDLARRNFGIIADMLAEFERGLARQR